MAQLLPSSKLRWPSVAMVLVLVALGTGAWQSYRGLPWSVRQRETAQTWIGRYQPLRAELVNEERAFHVRAEPYQGGKFRVFRAQFVLAPTVVIARRLDRLSLHELARTPIILDFDNDVALESALTALRGRAAAGSSLELHVEHYRRSLALVRATKAGPS